MHPEIVLSSVPYEHTTRWLGGICPAFPREVQRMGKQPACTMIITSGAAEVVPVFAERDLSIGGPGLRATSWAYRLSRPLWMR